MSINAPFYKSNLMKKNHLLFCSLLLLSSCAPKITTSIINRYKPLPAFTPITIYQKNDTLPENLEKLGSVDVVDYGFTNGVNYYSVINEAKTAAAKVGGNAIQVDKMRTPNLFNTGYQLEAEILKIDSVNKFSPSKRNSNPDAITKPNSFWHLALNGGYSYSLGKSRSNSNPRIQNYYSQLKSGYNIGVEIHYLPFNGQFGYGLNYELMNLQNSMDGVILNSDQNSVIGIKSDNKSIQYIGPSVILITRQVKNGRAKDALNLSLGGGYINFHNTQQVVTFNYQIDGATVGLRFAVGFDHYLSKSMALGLRVSLIAGLLSDYDKFDGTSVEHVHLTPNNYVNLSQLNISLGFSFNK